MFFSKPEGLITLFLLKKIVELLKTVVRRVATGNLRIQFYTQQLSSYKRRRRSYRSFITAIH